MRLTLMTLLLILSLKSFSQEDYKLQINDTVFDISVDSDYTIDVKGREVRLRLIAKDTLIYSNDMYSFKYYKDHRVSHMKIDEGIEQIMLITVEGSGVLIQKFSMFNPTMLNEMMISEVTKESLSYGYEMQREEYKRKLKSGQEIRVDRAILKYKDETNIYEVATIGKKDEGILIMTMVMDEKLSEQGGKIIDLMWNSLIYK